jgi:hypothetical protein
MRGLDEAAGHCSGHERALTPRRYIMPPRLGEVSWFDFVAFAG